MSKPPAASQSWSDMVALVAIIVVSAMPFLFGLEFYSDDWAFLLAYWEPRSEGLSEAIHAVVGLFPPRPGQGIYNAILITAFGLDPLPYHLVNLAVLSAFVLLLNRLLLRLGMDGATAFAISALFAVWPQISTVRVWFAAFQIPLSGVFFLLSTLIEIRSTSSRTGRLLGKTLSLAALAISLSLYELFAPAIVAVSLLLTLRDGRAAGARNLRDWLAAVVPHLPNILLTAGALAFKQSVAARAPASLDTFKYLAENFIRLSYDIQIDWGVNFWKMLELHFLFVPWSLVEAVLAAPDLPGLALPAAVTVALITGFRLARMHPRVWTVPEALRAIAMGVVILFLGYAIFFTTPNVSLSLAGIGNRASFAGVVGVILALVGVLHLVAAALGPARGPIFLTLAIGILAGLSGLRLAQIGTYWAGSDDIRQEQLAHAREDLAEIPPGAVVLIDGVCPYYGPAIVVEAYWDATAILKFATGISIAADTTLALVLRDDAATTTIYSDIRTYPYGPMLFLYNAPNRRLDQLIDAAQARAVLERSGRESTICPKGFLSHGAPI